MLGPVAGCAIKLDADEIVEEGLGICEGIETGLPIRATGWRPMWALGSAGAIATFAPIPGIECLTIFADHDHDRARRRAGLRRTLAGRRPGSLHPLADGLGRDYRGGCAMSDDEDNVVHFAPRADAPDEKESHVPNPLNLRRELHRNALTKGLVAFDEFGQQIMLQRPIPRPNLKGAKQFEPRPWTDATTRRSPSISTAAAFSVSGAI